MSSVIETAPVSHLSQVPGQLTVIRRDRNTTVFDRTRIALAITKAFWDVEGQSTQASMRIKQIVEKLTEDVVQALIRRYGSQGSGMVQVEDVQDQVELALMRNEYHQVARSYVLYREQRRLLRESRQGTTIPTDNSNSIQVTLPNGHLVPLDMAKLRHLLQQACIDLVGVDPEAILIDAVRNLFNGVKLSDVHLALTMSTRARIELEPAYTYVAARLLLSQLQREALSFLTLPVPLTFDEMSDYYPAVLQTTIQEGIKLDRLDPRLGEFDLLRLGKALVASRDLQFTYLGLQTLYDRYFLHENDQRFELPQVFFMRVAMGLSLLEDQKEARAIEFYHLLSSFKFMSSTPTLFNAGTTKPQLSSCYLTTIPDDLAGIYNAIRDNALLSKFAGGLGNNWSAVRAMGAYIKGTNGKSQGTVPFMKVANDTAVAVNQGGKRKGAVCGYLETWHLDIEEFLELRKNTGDERRRTHDMNTANWIPDLFMKRVMRNENWTLFSPNDVAKLNDLYGDAFENAYAAFEAKAKAGIIKLHKTLPALTLWRKMLGMLYETGHPWLTFKDPCNLRSPQSHVGVVHSSNLCTEITLNTSIDEIAVCNLGSINLVSHLTEKGLNIPALYQTVKTAIRMLDNVIDINFYPVIQARRSNLRHRPVGLGVMGFQDALYRLDIPYQSEAAVEFADRSMEHISYAAIQSSTDLAEERGIYSSFEGSLWSQGILPIDSIERLQANRGIYLDQDRSQTLDWEALRQRVCTVGMRNSNVLAIAPTATISNICGVSQSIEPTFQNLFVKSNLSGEFTVINPHLVNDLKALNLWDATMIKDLKYFSGSVQQINRIPAVVKAKYLTAFEIDPLWLIDAASRRQKWIDQAQSLNLYLAAPSGKKLDALYRAAWLRGLKTTYYLRTLAATEVERSTVHSDALTAVKPSNLSTQEAILCSLDNPDCEACQ
jgi:ribonucleoside-diphosphate reductase alpha chain